MKQQKKAGPRIQSAAIISSSAKSPSSDFSSVNVVLLADFYWACEFTGPDNCCLQGAHPIFGDYNDNSKTMLGWWGTTFVWTGCLGYNKSRVRNWCRARCALPRSSRPTHQNTEGAGLGCSLRL